MLYKNHVEHRIQHLIQRLMTVENRGWTPSLCLCLKGAGVDFQGGVGVEEGLEGGDCGEVEGETGGDEG